MEMEIVDVYLTLALGGGSSSPVPMTFLPGVRGWSENFSPSTIDGNTIGKIFSPKLVHLS